MRIREVTADEVVERARQQPPASREEFLKRASNCWSPEVCDSVRKLADSYGHGEKIDINAAVISARRAYMDMVGADGPPVSVSRLRFG